jgi:hypothetical protein
LGSTTSPSSLSGSRMARASPSSPLCHHLPSLPALSSDNSGSYSLGGPSLPPRVRHARPLACSSSTTVRPCQNSQVRPDQTNPRNNKISTLPKYYKQHIKHTTNIKISRSLLFTGNNSLSAGSLYN